MYILTLRISWNRNVIFSDIKKDYRRNFALELTMQSEKLAGYFVADARIHTH